MVKAWYPCLHFVSVSFALFSYYHCNSERTRDEDHLPGSNDSYCNKLPHDQPWDSELPDHLLTSLTSRTHLWLGLNNNYVFLSPCPQLFLLFNPKANVSLEKMSCNATFPLPTAASVYHVINFFSLPFTITVFCIWSSQTWPMKLRSLHL
jgi:hypothetical protein